LVSSLYGKPSLHVLWWWGLSVREREKKMFFALGFGVCAAVVLFIVIVLVMAFLFADEPLARGMSGGFPEISPC